MRLQKYMAQCGVASRRACEQIILQGRVRVNGRIADTMGQVIDPARDIVSVDGKRIVPASRHVCYAFYKPRGVVSTNQDERGRKCVGDFFQNVDRRLFPVGRLDYHSEGLMLITDDGELAQRLLHPSGGVLKTYRATLSGHYRQQLADQLLAGVDIGDVRPARAIEMSFRNREDGRSVLTLSIDEGRNRQIRRMLEAQGYDAVLRLIRIAIGGYEMGDMRPGSHRRMTDEQIQRLFAPRFG